MLKTTVLKPTVNIRRLNSTVPIIMLSMLAVLTGCQTVPTALSKAPSAMAMNNPLTIGMPAIDRQGYIAYVEEQGVGTAKISTLYRIRPDGSGLQLIDQLNGYIYAPTWSADGQMLAYSKQAARQHPKIYIYDVKSSSHNLVVNVEGSNLSPSFSPDGKKLLYSSTVGGNADIYEMQLSDGSTKQLTTLPSTEVQPSYASDGQSFVYTSDKVRAGRPSIYRYSFATGNAALITTGGYAASPQLSLDSQRLAYLNGRKAAVMMLTTGQVINLAETGLDEPARLSPSGQYALYPTRQSNLGGQVGGQSSQSGGSLVIHSLAGNTSYAISSKTGGVVRSPIWGR
ncbi:PD40 domain-containing protein [Psychrobacter cryohalolentis]|uniref:WD-40 repeat-containing protein n=1 Tax=Psychrobacter cryohalolentis (strain ATCC BAA-1226 / DSM 17306 / VKM B-2378 / K5) TaxID=335284 RepID=Q1QDM4_PSYCK|nr:PD40 domain-containing protein [Psychrobacter cryohalolentis]ABE74229.1 WD-40 repeat-containing protein [Psychrobacter cryohalolentis K5]ASE26861.1 Xaa-Pro aminopeptidase [Psychrobacter cryohalolentis]